jgi:hypothetical protein
MKTLLVKACYFLNLYSYIISWKNSHDNYLGCALISGFYIINSFFFQPPFSITSNTGLYHIDQWRSNRKVHATFPSYKRSSWILLHIALHYSLHILDIVLRHSFIFFAAAIYCLNKNAFKHFLVQWSEQASSSIGFWPVIENCPFRMSPEP